MSLDDVPLTAAWRHLGTRHGFEAVSVRRPGRGYRLQGAATAVQDRQAWTIAYWIALDEHWVTERARVCGWSTRGACDRLLESVGPGGWHVDGRAAPGLDGCVDVDLEASACTNTVPIHRLGLEVGASADAPAAYVRADGGVERLEQTYARLEDDGECPRCEYRAPAFEFEARLVFDRAGLVLDYPGIAARAF